MEDSETIRDILKAFTPELSLSSCVVNNDLMRLSDIQSMGYHEFWIRSKQFMPRKLYKYFPNTINNKSQNHSQEALKLNTVFLQSPSEYDDVYDSDIHIEYIDYEKLRLQEYCRRCGVEIFQHSSTQELGDQLIQRLYNVWQDTGSFDSAIVREPHSRLEDLSNKILFKRIQIELSKGFDLGQAVSNVIGIEYKEYVLQLKNTFKTACFTTTPYSQLMWSSYANQHHGFCIEYTVLSNNVNYTEIYHNLFPVVYCKVRPNMTERIVAYKDREPTEENIWDIYLHGALRKSGDWAYQNEWRLLLPLGKTSSDSNVVFFPITKVFLGNRMKGDDRKEIIEICKSRDIPYIGVIRNPDYFEMQDCTIRCEDCSKCYKDS